MPDNEVTMEVDNFGNKFWRNKNGVFHRLDGPAIEYSDGGKQWYLNGVLHREGCPAVIYADGSKSWYLNGVEYETKESYFDALSYEGKRLCLISEDFLNA